VFINVKITGPLFLQTRSGEMAEKKGRGFCGRWRCLIEFPSLTKRVSLTHKFPLCKPTKEAKGSKAELVLVSKILPPL